MGVAASSVREARTSSVAVSLMGCLVLRSQPLTVTDLIWLAVVSVGLKSISENPHFSSRVMSRSPAAIPACEGPK